MKKINNLNELKHLETKEYFILLKNGIRSSKSISYNNGIFYIRNSIDDSIDELTEEQMNDTRFTNIGEAIKKDAFFLN